MGRFGTEGGHHGAYEMVTTTRRERLASFEAQRDSAFAADAEHEVARA